MKISIRKNDDNRRWCHNHDCLKLPEYIEYRGESRRIHFIKVDTIIAIMDITTSSFTEEIYFCKDCIGKIYQDMKKTMNTNLWAFK